MTGSVQVLIFSLVLAYSFFQGFCIPPAPTRTPNKSDASLAFIAGESGVPNIPNIPGNRPGGPIQSPNVPQNTGLTSNQRLSYGGIQTPSNPNQKNPGTVIPKPIPQGQPQTSGRRDFVNVNHRIAGVQNSNVPKPSGTTEVPKVVPQSGGRDFVNPNYKPGQVGPSGGQVPQKQQGTTQRNVPAVGPSTGSRDFVNPNYNRNQPPNSPVSLQSIIGPKDPFPTLKPVPQSPEVKPRDPFPPLRSKEPFPPLPGSQGSSQGSSGPIGSYAGKVSGGITTSKPVISKPSGNRSGTGDSTKEDPEKKYEDNGPKDNELREFSEQLLKKDVNNAFKYVKLNVQGKTTSQSKNDEAPQNLLEINQDAFKLPTVQKLVPFYNNYILEVSENEYVTPQERNEEEDFLETVVNTPIMQHTRNFLINNGKIGKDPKEFKDLLRTTWFSMYSRGHGKVGSSGFEHVFLAELKKDKNEVSGLHNWIYFHEAEQKKLVNYLGYMKKVDLGEKGAILKFHFSLNDVDKPVSSIFVGTSPELEMALYTTCYVFRPNRVCPLRLAGHNFIVRAYSLKYRGKQLLGSAFPEI